MTFSTSKFIRNAIVRLIIQHKHLLVYVQFTIFVFVTVTGVHKDINSQTFSTHWPPISSLPTSLYVRYTSRQTFAISSRNLVISAGTYATPGNTSLSRLFSSGMSSAISFGTIVSITDWINIYKTRHITQATFKDYFCTPPQHSKNSRREEMKVMIHAYRGTYFSDIK